MLTVPARYCSARLDYRTIHVVFLSLFIVLVTTYNTSCIGDAKIIAKIDATLAINDGQKRRRINILRSELLLRVISTAYRQAPSLCRIDIIF